MLSANPFPAGIRRGAMQLQALIRLIGRDEQPVVLEKDDRRDGAVLGAVFFQVPGDPGRQPVPRIDVRNVEDGAMTLAEQLPEG